MKRREFIKGATALVAYSQLEKAEALTNNQLLTVLGGLTVPAEAKALFARFTTPPSATYQAAIARLINSLKSCGAWSNLDTFYGLAAADTQSALLNWVSTSFNLTATNTPTFTANQGYTGNGTNSYLESNYNFSSSGGNFAQNSASLGVFVLNGGNAGADIGGLTGGSFNFIRPYYTGGVLSAFLNATGTTTFAVNNATGLSVIARSASNLEAVYRDGTLLGSPINSSAALPNATLRILTGDGTFSNHQVAFAFSGANLTASQVSAINAAIRAYLTAIGTSVVDPVTPYATWRGAWNTGGNAISGSVAFSARDAVSYSGGYYFCVSGYTTSGASTTPDVDTTHWQPLSIISQQNIFSDSFDTGAGAFNGRVVSGLTWYTTGLGYQNAIVTIPSDGDGYATSFDNTYFVMPGMTGPVTELTAVEYDTASALFTLAIGGNGGANTIFEEMVHTNFDSSGVTPLYWHSGAVAQPFSSPRFTWSSGWTSTAGVRQTCTVQIRGNFLFAFVDNVLVYILCHDLIATILAASSEVFVQNHAGPALGDQKHYSVTVKKAA